VITRPDEVEIFEPILGDQQGHVTTGLINAIRYLKDNRILPSGFDKATAGPDIQVVGDAKDDAGFVGGSSRTRYQITAPASAGPYTVSVELWYQPIGYRWAHNLGAYHAMEPQRFLHYFEQDSADTAVILARAEASY
jgi:hypothetical protein